MTEKEKRAAAKQFASDWHNRGDEKQETQSFWLSLLQKVFGVAEPEKYIRFEMPVKLDNTSFIDGFIKDTLVLIEQKSMDVNLDKKHGQSDGSSLTPYEQARRYGGYLNYGEQPRWIVVCNFQEFRVHDMTKPNDAPEIIMLSELEKEYHRLQFLVNAEEESIKKETEISVKAGELVDKLYGAILKQYKDPENPETLRSLNVLCVRLVFCLYAEDAGVFGGKDKFGRYLKKFPAEEVRSKLIELFEILNTPIDQRDPYKAEELLDFPYVNGGLFKKDNIEIPRFTPEIVDLLVDKASMGFDWSEISPTIFGAVFESTLNPVTRRSGGMHYTSIENIHKVIDPLFLDQLKSELEAAKALKTEKTRVSKLTAFTRHLSSLTFLDPACGSGNFLTETYLSLRKLENEALEIIYGDGQGLMDDDGGYIKVNISQFYGIEINDFAVSVATTALWIAELQMKQKTEQIIGKDIDYFPLKSNAYIKEGNALTIDWESVVAKEKLSYIMGNPPFVGHQMRSKAQAKDMEIAFYDLPKHGKLDYVCAWYNKAADFMKNTEIQTAFVSTNSIIQGESVGILWKFLFEEKNVEIQFAYQSFVWDSEANSKAHVHCVIIGFSALKIDKEKRLYCDNVSAMVKHINGYLISAPDVFIQSRGKPLTSNMPEMSKGSQPTDGGNLILSEIERNELISQYPETSTFIRRYISADDYINNKYRYCLWLNDISPTKYRNIPIILKRLEKVAECRRKSPTDSVKLAADTPMIFTQIRQPNTMYLAMPEVSSSRRRYIPFGYMPPEVIASNMLYLVPNVDLFMFGVMTSNVHMSWLRVVGGRLKSDYRYTPAVYNNFPWCNPTDKQKALIEQTAQDILDTRAKYHDCSLADLYDKNTMPPELRKAHRLNDNAVCEAYGFPKNITESECVAELMKMYQTLTEGK